MNHLFSEITKISHFGSLFTGLCCSFCFSDMLIIMHLVLKNRTWDWKNCLIKSLVFYSLISLFLVLWNHSTQFHISLLSPWGILCACVCSVTQLCSTLCDPMDYSPPGSSVHGISQVRILEGAVIFSSRGSSWTQGLNPCLLHWNMDSLPLSHMGRPMFFRYISNARVYSTYVCKWI